MSHQIQTQLLQLNHNYSHGGALRNKRRGRGERPLSGKDPVHVVFKINRRALYSRSLRTHCNFSMVQKIIQKYAKKFFVYAEQVSIQSDHVHLLIRTKRRSQFHHFFRVTTGQIAQQLEKAGAIRSIASHVKVTDTPKKQNAPKNPKDIKNGEKIKHINKIKLWLHRPFSRVVKGHKAYQIVRNYIQLNEKEALGEIPYKIQRLRGLSMAEWQILWS